MVRISIIMLLFAAGMISNAAEVVEISSSFVRDLETAKEIRRFERCLIRLLNPKRCRECRLRIELGDPSAPAGIHADFFVIPWRVKLNGGRAWAKDLLLGSRLGGILGVVHSGGTAQKTAEPFPLWLTAALFQQMLEQDRTERYLNNNRRFPVAGALLQAGEQLNLKSFAAEINTPADSAERLWQQEFGRLLLDLSAAYTPEIFGTTIPFFRSRFSAEKKQNAAELRSDEPARTIWHHPEFIPASFLKHDFQEMMKMQISAIDKEGVPTGDSVEITLDQIPEKLKNHPEEKVIRDLFIRRVQEFCRRVPAEFSSPLSRLISAIRELDFSEKSSAELKRKMKDCRNFLTKRAARSAVLDQAEKNNAGLQRYAPVFSCDWSFSMLNEQERKILDRTEKFFNR